MNGEAGDQTGLIKRLSYPLYECKGWMKLVGVINIIAGVIQALTCIGIVIAWLPIWLGILLFQCANSVEQAYAADSDVAMIRSLSKLKIYFIITGVLTLIGIIFMVAALFLGIFSSIISIPHMR